MYIVKCASYKGYKNGEEIPKKLVDLKDVESGLIQEIKSQTKTKEK